MTTTTAYPLAGLIAAGIIFIGGRFILAPRVAAAGYGVQPDLGQSSVVAYLRVKGVRGGAVHVDPTAPSRPGISSRW